ncbi:Inhibitor of growth protein 5 [Halotydeus destructor]|nr:Inhibitor of growth protein 5 [Halotydeus destructor]
MSFSYYEQFLDSMENLPADLRRNMTLLGELDGKSQELFKKMQSQVDEYVANAERYDPESKTKKFSEYKQTVEKNNGYCDDKIQLANQTYEMVDKWIRKLDSTITKVDADLNERLSKKISTPGTSREEPKKKGRAIKKGFNPKNVIKDDDKKSAPAVADHLLVPPSEVVMDMPVDPNEPTYCICHQVSYGEMIGCDNSDCPIEWFHFGCVSLSSKPKGKWFCPKCTNDRKKK